MFGKIFDTHAHYDDDAFTPDRTKVIEKIQNNGVCGVINAGTDLSSSLKSIELCNKYDFFYAAVGIHPLNSEELDPDFLDKLAHLIKYNKKVMAIGEIGLDYHTEPFSRENQVKVFTSQLQLAKDYNLPVIVHIRDAGTEYFNLLKNNDSRGVVHCFSGNVDLALELIKLGIYIGVGGVLTFKNAKKLVDVVNNIPLGSIVLETDCPYMAPVPFRGKRCDSSMILYVAQKVAELKSMEVDEVLKITEENARRLFNIS